MLGAPVGAIAVHIVDISVCGEPDLSLKTRRFSEKRFGKLEAQEKSSVRAGMELAREEVFSATLTQENFAKNVEPPPTFPELRAGWKNLLSMHETKLRQCRLGGLCWVAAVSLPDICACLARIASRVD